MKSTVLLVFFAALVSQAAAQPRSKLDGLSEVEVVDETSLIAVIDNVYTQLGFTGAESLEYQYAAPMGDTTSYHFLEHINGIPTQNIITFVVEQSRILTVLGNPIVDEGFRTEHKMTGREAVEAVLEHIAKSESRSPPIAKESADDVLLIYRTLSAKLELDPWWSVSLDGVGDYYVGPNGEVEANRENIVF